MPPDQIYHRLACLGPTQSPDDPTARHASRLKGCILTRSTSPIPDLDQIGCAGASSNPDVAKPMSIYLMYSAEKAFRLC
ncbi:hypothetical protein [Roseovarius sp. D0-M9]|uniref:hypothetical protein n=1 Tax=Roseovarius sp. D0-M9 TaxID=3127117 RepID=UPI00300FBB05